MARNVVKDFIAMVARTDFVSFSIVMARKGYKICINMMASLPSVVPVSSRTYTSNTFDTLLFTH